VVHLGIVVIAIGIIGSNAFQLHRDINIREGESVAVGRYTLTYTGSFVEQLADREVAGSNLRVVRDGEDAGVVTPKTEYFENFPNPSSKVAILTTPLDDLYVFQASKPEDSQVTLSIFVNPLTVWVWVGGTMLFLGYIICAWPEPRPVRVTYAAPEGATARGA
jgi:cytochrome c-type biogenesis protein CcmF